MRKNFLFRFVTFYSSFSILLQSFLPFAYITPQIAFSQDSTQTTATETVTPTAEPTVAPNSEPTVAPTSEPTVAPTTEPTVAAPTATPTDEVSPTSVPTGTVEPSVTPTFEPTVAPTGQATEGNSTHAPTGENANPTAIPGTPTVTVAPTSAAPLADEVVVAQIVKLDGSYADPNLVPATWTDKLDYHPTEKVVVSGKNFIAGQTYSITISSTDDPAVTHNGTFVANTDGTFTYEYQLDGNYRPNYSVSIKDASGTVVATTTFTDSRSISTAKVNGLSAITVLPGGNVTAELTVVTTGSGEDNDWDSTSWRISTTAPGSTTCYNTSDHSGASTYTESFNIIAPSTPGVYNAYFIAHNNGDACSASGQSSTITLPNAITVVNPTWNCSNDSAGANDLSGQKDLTKMCSNTSNLPTYLFTKWNWDETGWSGNNSGDACNLFDTDSDGKANYALCVTIKHDPATFDSKTLYSCTDGSSNKCTGGAAISTTSSSCNASVLSEDPFSAGTDFPEDTVGSCSIKMSDIGGGLSANLIDVCSFPSTVPNSDPSDCIFYKPSSGKLEVVKALVPTNDTGLFNLQVDSATAGTGTNVGNNGTTSTQIVSAANHTVGETAGTSTILSDYTSSVLCKDNHGTGSVVSTTGSNPWTLTVADGKDIVCTITNTRISNGSITIIKDAVPNDAQDFAFTTTGTGLSNFSLDDDADGTLSNTKVFSTLAAGTYAVAETAVSGWTQTSATCTDGSPVSAIALGAGENVTCTFTNTKDAKLTVTKTVTNNNGGTKVVADFPLFVDSTGVTSGTKNTFSIGAHVVSETPDAGYVGTFGGACDANGNVTLAAGDDKTCTIVNDDKAPALHLRKTVTNDNGGTAVAADWTLTATGTVVSPSNLSGTTPVDSNNSGFKADTYTLGETGPSGYSAGDWSCIGGTQNANTITVALGESATCTINNDDIAPSLTLVKTVTTDNGGTAVAADWTLTATGPTTISGAGGVTSDSTFDIGTYTLSESAGPTGYTAGLWSCIKNNNAPVTGSSITLSFGDTATCTINNDDQPATLTVVKRLTKDNGGTLACDDFSFTVNGGDSIPFEADCSNTMTVNAGTYSVVEDPQSGYTPTYNNCSNLILGNGGNATCTVTNDDQPATFIVKKVVVNDNGGTLEADDFTFKVNGGTAMAFEADGQNDLTVNAGTYSITEPAVAGYATTYDNCSSVVISNGGTATCTITNNDIQPKLTVTKVVKNDNGGTNVVADFPLFVNATGVTSGVQNGFNAGTYTVSETGLTTYASAISGDCATNGSITLALGDTKSCTITNDDIKPQLHLVKEIINDNGGTAAATDWTLTATGTKDDPTNLSGSTQVNSPNTFLADTYTLGESGPSGYSASNWACTGGVQNGNTITVGLGDDATCTITNDDIAPKLHLRKIIVNNNGGTAVLGDVTLTANGTGSNDISGTSPVDSDSTLKADTFALSESALVGYTASDWVCTGGTQSGSNITVGLNQEATCTITNDDNKPSLTLVKVVDILHGGTAVAADWNLSATGPTSISGDGGVSSGNTFAAGTYTLAESAGPSGYTQGSFNCTNDIAVDKDGKITLGLGESTTCTVYNADQPATLFVKKHVINDNGGTKEAKDFDLTVEGTEVAPNAFKGNEDGVEVTLDAGEYSVNETTVAGYAKSLSADCSGTIGVGETKTCTVTNDDTYGKVQVTKFNDLNGNGTQDEGEPNLSDWEIKLTDFTNQTTDENGTTEFSPVLPGDYTVGEVQQQGWKLTGINCSTITPTPSPEPSVSPTATPTPVSSKMNICHYNASSSRWNALQISDSAWPTHQTHGDELNRDYLYGGPLAPNGHPAPHTGEEWCRTHNPLLTLGFGAGIVNAATEGDNIPTTKDITVGTNETVQCTIGNQFITPELTIAKFNTTWPSNTTPGNEVQFTLRLKLSKNNIKNLLVTDLPANGFKYKPGSYNVKIDGTDVTGSITEPVYHSPGKWNIGDVNLGENEEVEILLSYTATVDPNIKPGLYKDLAWAYGCETEECAAKVLALSAPSGTTDPGEVTDNFVGSKVGVDKEVQNTTSTDIKKEQKSTGEVLGASTSLPSTGASTIWLYIMSLLSGFGIISILMGLFLKKGLFRKVTLTALVTLLAVNALASGKPVQAVVPDNLTIRISEPKTPTNSLFNLVFVTLDLEGRDLTVKCYKKNPTDGGYSQFGANISLLATGGNSGECEITESLLSQKGTYNFYTTVEASGEGPVQSQIVAVDYNNSEGPSTPTNYSKDHISSCQYKISFKTADDSGKTVKVEIYRNENTSFGLNSSTRVGTVTIGSNTDGSYTDSVPDCNKTYYYVIRAFDSFGNGSGIIGDSVVTVTTSTTTTTTSTTGGTTGGGAIPVEGGANIAGESEVLGVQTFITPGASGSGRILGEQTEAKKSTLGKVLGAVTGKNMRPWYVAAVVLAIGILGYVIYRKKTQGGI